MIKESRYITGSDKQLTTYVQLGMSYTKQLLLIFPALAYRRLHGVYHGSTSSKIKRFVLFVLLLYVPSQQLW